MAVRVWFDAVYERGDETACDRDTARDAGVAGFEYVPFNYVYGAGCAW